MSKQPKVAVIMGSDSDFQALKGCIKFLKEYGVEVDVNVISAHRTPEAAEAFAKGASDNGFDLIIAAAGKAVTPGGAVEICRILGKDETLRRIHVALEKLT